MRLRDLHPRSAVQYKRLPKPDYLDLGLLASMMFWMEMRRISLLVPHIIGDLIDEEQ